MTRSGEWPDIACPALRATIRVHQDRSCNVRPLERFVILSEAKDHPAALDLLEMILRFAQDDTIGRFASGRRG